MPLAANTKKNAGRSSNGGGTVRRRVSGMSLSHMGGSLNTVAACENSVMANFAEFLFHALGCIRATRRQLPQPSGPSSLNDPGLLPLVDPVDASVGALEIAIGVVRLLDASDLAQKLASGLSQFL